MHLFSVVTVSFLALLVADSYSAYAQERDRSKIPDDYKWNLSDLYPTGDAWKKAEERLSADIPGMNKFQGTLGSSPAQLLSCLEYESSLAKEYSRLSSYASMSSDQDTRDSKYLAMKSEMNQIGATLGAAVAFVEPEILKIDKTTIDSFIT